MCVHQRESTCPWVTDKWFFGQGRLSLVSCIMYTNKAPTHGPRTREHARHALSVARLHK